jgi:hypothetical protein
MSFQAVTQTDLRELLVRASLSLAWFMDARSKVPCCTAFDAQLAHTGSSPPASPTASPLRVLATAAAAGNLLAAEVASPSAVPALADAVINTVLFFSQAVVYHQSTDPGRPPWAHLSAAAMKEPRSSVAHSSIFIVALVSCPSASAWGHLVTPLADGIARLQLDDGTFQVYYDDPGSDIGWELYGTEAALGVALAARFVAASDQREAAALAHAAWRAVQAYKHRFTACGVRPACAVYFLNWLTQAAHATSQAMAAIGDEATACAAAEAGCELSDCLASHSGPLHAAIADPASAATVEVACALEGVADALSMATRQGDAHRVVLFERAARAGVAHLARVQAASRECATCGQLPVGAAYGFGASLSAPGNQRCDVMAHAITALVKLLPLAAKEHSVPASEPSSATPTSPTVFTPDAVSPEMLSRAEQRELQSLSPTSSAEP